MNEPSSMSPQVMRLCRRGRMDVMPLCEMLVEGLGEEVGSLKGGLVRWKGFTLREERGARGVLSAVVVDRTGETLWMR